MATKKEWKQRALEAEARLKGLEAWAAELQRRVDYLMPKPLPHGTSVIQTGHRPYWMAPLVEPKPEGQDLFEMVKQWSLEQDKKANEPWPIFPNEDTFKLHPSNIRCSTSAS